MKDVDIERIYNDICSSFVIEKDEEYYKAVKKKFSFIRTILSVYKADDVIIKTVDAFGDTLLCILREYYKGNIALSQTKMNNQIKKICTEDKKAVNDINNCNVFDGDMKDISFFRARTDADEDGFKAKDMGVIPFSLRIKTTTERFSMPGLPCLYIGNTSYVCWLELGKPADYRFNVSPVLLDRTQKVFDLTVPFGHLFDKDSKGNKVLVKDITVGFVKRIMITICSLFRVKEQNRNFKSEYIIPQLVMLACKKEGFDGVAYISSKISNPGMFGVCAVNVALYSRYTNNRFNVNAKTTELDKHVKIGDAFNYGMFKQLNVHESSIKSPLWIDRCRWIKNIEIYNEQHPYMATKFYEFDKYIFCHWTDNI